MKKQLKLMVKMLFQLLLILTDSNVDLSKLSRMENICDLNKDKVKELSEGPKETKFTCIMSR